MHLFGGDGIRTATAAILCGRIRLLGLDLGLGRPTVFAVVDPTIVLHEMREKVALLEGLEEALGAMEHHLVCVRRGFSADVNLVRGRLDARVAAVRTLVLLLPRVSHLVTAESVVVPAPVVAYITPEIGRRYDDRTSL